jgi:hypothetical protein
MSYNKTEDDTRLTAFEIYHAEHCVEVLREVCTFYFFLGGGSPVLASHFP